MSRRETAALAVLALLIAAAYAWSGHFWIDLVDEGYFLDLGQRVLNGQLPYRDFTTYYTPGIFYLFALAFKLFGTNLLVIRYLMAAIRAICAVLLYLLARRVAPWPLAWLPFAVVALLDHWPIEPEPHPSWPSIVLCLLTLELVARHLDSRKRRWLALAGASAGLAFLFKQNVGAFTALGLAGYVMLRRREAAVVYALGTAALVTALMWAELDVVWAGALWAPLVVTLGVLAVRRLRAASLSAREVVADATAAAMTFAMVTVAWLVPLVLAVGPAQTPVSLFLGSVNQDAIKSPFEPFTSGVPPLLLTVIWVAALAATTSANRLGPVLIAVAFSALVLQLPTWQGAREPLTYDPRLLPLLNWLDQSFGTLHEYLPSLATWAGVAGLLAVRNTPSAYPWYVLFGGLAALTMYPRADTLHAIVSSPVPLIGAAGAITLLWRRLKREHAWRRYLALATALLIPLAADAPQSVAQFATLVAPEGTREWFDYASLDLSRAQVLIPRLMAEDLHGVVSFVESGTPPGEPVFAYPVAPLFNFLADRPNPTRFDHFLRGTLTSADFAQVIDELARTRPRYVIWDHGGVVIWQTDLTNRPLSDYIWRCYDEVAAFRLFLVLERRAAEC